MPSTRLPSALAVPVVGRSGFSLGDDARHALRVGMVAGAVTGELGLDDRCRHRVVTAALLHDIGKAVVPRAVCMKPGPLTAGEWILMRCHPEAGAQIAAALTPDAEVLSAIRSHHERWDGAGYPDGLSGAAIPVGGRILAVADAFAAMTEARPYRAPVSFASALLELQLGRGRQFEPNAVAAFEATVPRLRRRLRSAGSLRRLQRALQQSRNTLEYEFERVVAEIVDAPRSCSGSG